jgi:lipopolysaccharide export LptBFGC system permease protein LptF
MKKLSFVVLFLAPFFVISQTFKKGYFIENNGQKTECLISTDVLLYSPEVIDYRLDISGQTQTKTINDLKVERYKRDASPITVLMLTIIGAVVAGRKVRGGSGVHLALGFATAAIFIITDNFFCRTTN